MMTAACGDSDEPGETAPVSARTEPATLSLAAIAPKGRLPAGVRPDSYQIDLNLDPRQDGFSGGVRIGINLDEPTDLVWLHGKGLVVNDVTATTEAGERVSGTYEEVLPSGVSAISFEKALPRGVVSLELRYDGRFNRNLAGLFKVEEQGEAYVLAKSESIQARSFLPGFDEPGLKATFDTRLTIPVGHEAIGNSPVIDKRDLGDGMQELVFATTPPMATYLLSLAVGPFEIVEREAIPPNDIRSRPVPLRGIARKGRGGHMNYVLDVTAGMIAIFERELQRPYPFRKLDIVAAPQWPSGATELSAAITYREQLILVGDAPAEGARLALLGVHAHEIAHMWFGNQVTPPWWDDLWLKEGFATWATPLVLELLEPDGGHDLNAATRSIEAMQLDSLASTRAIREPISNNEEIRNAYDSITYSKSLGVINMVDRYFGSDVFRPALGRYIEAYSEGVADSPAFYAMIGEETRTPALTGTFRSFVEQTGVPVLEVSLSCETDDTPSLELQQSRYKALGSPISDENKVWNIPVCLRSNNGDHCLMLAEARKTLPLADAECPQFVMPNAGGSGYYRWTLDENSWSALIENFESLSSVEALSAIDSAFAAFEAGGLDEEKLLGIVTASSRSESRQVVTAPLPYLQKYVRHYFSNTDRAKFLEFARRLYDPLVDSSGKKGDGDSQLLHAELLGFMALSAHEPGARKQLLDMAHSFTGFGGGRDADALHSDLYEAALTVAVQDSDAGFLTHLVRLRGELDDPLFEKASANAIGRATAPEQVGEVHALAFEEKLGPREVFDMVSQALSEPALADEHWAWFQDNFPALIDRIPAQWRRFTPGMAGGFCEAEKRDELTRLFDAHGDLVPGYRRGLDQAAEKIELCVAQREQGKRLVRGISIY
jgi:alanyl aminopeptidase